jgi:hypothetical protein
MRRENATIKLSEQYANWCGERPTTGCVLAMCNLSAPRDRSETSAAQMMARTKLLKWVVCRNFNENMDLYSRKSVGTAIAIYKEQS